MWRLRVQFKIRTCVMSDAFKSCFILLMLFTISHLNLKKLSKHRVLKADTLQRIDYRSKINQG